VFVSTGGNDSTCVRDDSSKPCATFQKAYNLSQCGDTIGVIAGTYNDVGLDANGSNCSVQTVFQPVGGVVTIQASVNTGSHDSLAFGSACKCSSGPPPNHITFDGGSSRDFHFGVPGVDGSGGRFGQIKLYADYDDDVYPSNITLTNLIVANGAPDEGNGTIELTSAQNFTLSNSIVGPICCGLVNGQDSASPAELLIGSRAGLQVSNHVNIDNNVFLGETHLPGQYWPAVLGPAPQGTCNSCHTDAVHVVAGNDLNFYDNKFYNSQTQALFFESIQNPVTNVTIVGNYIDSLAGCGVCLNAGDGGGGKWLVAFNTSNAGLGFYGSSGFPAGSSLTYIGNYGPLPSTGCSYSASNVTVSYSYDVWTSGDKCASTDKAGAFDVLHAGDWASHPPDNGVNYDLAAGSPAIAFVPASICTALTTTDLHGKPRPNPSHLSFCDAGADETR